VAVLFASSNLRNPSAFAGKSVPQEKSRAVFRKKNPYCLSVTSLRILGIPPGFSAFGGLGPRPFVTFGAMPKVNPHLVFD